ncbi:phosphatase 2C-like domain-containing protein, partial [Gorgonomyces haynaldii]
PPHLSVQVGEDAFFTRYDSLGALNLIVGANPALYSLKLMHYCFMELDKYDNYLDDVVLEYDQVDPRQILETAWEQVNKDAREENIIGSSTALLCVLRHDQLRICNIGDCGIMIIRDGEPVFRNEEQQHSFNFPYQLGTVKGDTPNDAQLFTVKVQEGDIVILASDGIFDNIFDEDILELVNKQIELQHDVQKISHALLLKASQTAEDSRSASTPFQERAVQEGFYYQGGKVDDMTVLVAAIKTLEDSPDRR